MVITTDLLNSIPHTRHGFFTRIGGVSENIAYKSLNTCFETNDPLKFVTENRKRVLASLDLYPDKLMTVKQQATNNAVIVKGILPDNKRPVADGMVTDVPGIALGIQTADCVPILFADKEKKIIGAAHAGWRGAVTGIVENTVAKMYDLGSKRERIAAAVGPCIAQKSYEVGEDVFEEFTKQDIRNEVFFKPSQNEGKFMLDLQSYVCNQLIALGIRNENITAIPLDTYSDEDRFFSYRRAVHRNERDPKGNIAYGRQISAITLT